MEPNLRNVDHRQHGALLRGSASASGIGLLCYLPRVRYLFAVIADRRGEVVADRDEMAAIDAFNQEIEVAGQRVMAAGVAAPDHAIVVDNRDGRGLATNGPAVDSDLFMAGFWVIEAESDAVAHALAAKASEACNRLIEVRPFLR
jgi:hypothetical protein